MTLKYNSLPQKTLAEPLTASSTSFRLNNIENWAGTDLAASDFGTVAYGVIRDAKGTKVEFFAFDPATIADADIDFTYRGLSFNGTDLTTEVSANKLEWGKGSIVELGTHGPQIFQWLQELIEGIAIAGSPNSATGTKGIGRVSVAPADPDIPIFVGDNDPRIVSVSAPSTPQSDDEGKLVKLNANGLIPEGFISTGVVDVQMFTANGTWTKPTQGTIAMVECIGGGGGGGGGGIDDTTEYASGGGGGGGGGYSRTFLRLDTLAATVSITIGTGGAGGAGKASGSQGNGSGGNNGGISSFGAHVKAQGGTGGSAGLQNNGAAPAGTGGVGNAENGADGSAGGSSTGGTNASGGDARLNAGSGGGGGGYGSGQAGGAGGAKTCQTLAGGTSGAANSGTAAGNGNTYDADEAIGGSGGGGGGGWLSNTANGANGGNGGLYGGGGGGGGSNASTTYRAGNGGNGGDGVVRIIVF